MRKEGSERRDFFFFFFLKTKQPRAHFRRGLRGKSWTKRSLPSIFPGHGHIWKGPWEAKSIARQLQTYEPAGWSAKDWSPARAYILSQHVAEKPYDPHRWPPRPGRSGCVLPARPDNPRPPLLSHTGSYLKSGPGT